MRKDKRRRKEQRGQRDWKGTKKKDGWRETECQTETGDGGKKKKWCSDPGRRGEKGAAALTPLCLSQVGKDGRGCEA